MADETLQVFPTLQMLVCVLNEIVFLLLLNFIHIDELYFLRTV